MTREVRQREILILLDKETGISAGDLAQRFHVSRMTIHRDLRSLLKQGLLFRIQGGAVKKELVVKGGAAEHCTFCRRRLLPHQCSEITKADGAVEVACCPACGLRQFSRHAASEQFLVGDQITGMMFRAEDAYFLINSLVSPCCQPSILSFADKGEVTLFQSGFGGSIARLDEALEFLRVAEGLV